MKKWIFWAALLATIMLAWCAKTQVSNISFDIFSDAVKSPFIYTATKITSDNPNIEKVYTTSASGFQSSIIIASEAVLSWDSVSFANNNLKTIREWIAKNKWEILNTDNIEITCGEKEIPGIISTMVATVAWQTRYITQLYFVSDLKWYVVSHLSEDKSDADSVNDSLKDITCKK